MTENKIIIDRLVLASASPRRKALLTPYVRELIIEPTSVEELFHAQNPEEVVTEISIAKLSHLPLKYRDCPILTSDTIVWHNEKILGKPKDYNDAYRILSNLSGQWHSVFTGFCIAYEGNIFTDYDQSEVLFKQLSHDDINDYIISGSPMDKAGAYGIQDGIVVQQIEGNTDTVLGLPVAKVLKVLSNLQSILTRGNY